MPAMVPGPDSGTAVRDVHCPRCGYNLRGLTVPRCPECGLAFEFAELESGFLRQNIPTGLDRCDPWQPHQVLLRSLAALVGGAVRVRRRLRTIDLNGPLTPAWLMLAGGTLWLWLLTTGLAAVGVAVHTGVSPAAAIKAAAWLWAPAMLAAHYAAAVGALAVLELPGPMRVARPTVRQKLRLIAYLAPALAAQGCVPLAVTLALVPDFALGVRWVWPLVTLLRGLAAARGELRPGGVRRRELAVSLLGVGLGTGAALFLTAWLLPETLEPPAWAYF